MHPADFFLQQPNHAIDEEMADGPVILRKRRAAQAEKNTCQLFIQTDHLFYKYYGSRDAVIAQVHLKHRWLSGIWYLQLFTLYIYMVVLLGLQISSHVKAIDSIYQNTDFKGIRNIGFMVKRIKVSVFSLSSVYFLIICMSFPSEIWIKCNL